MRSGPSRRCGSHGGSSGSARPHQGPATSIHRRGPCWNCASTTPASRSPSASMRRLGRMRDGHCERDRRPRVDPQVPVVRGPVLGSDVVPGRYAADHLHLAGAVSRSRARRDVATVLQPGADEHVLQGAHRPSDHGRAVPARPAVSAHGDSGRGVAPTSTRSPRRREWARRSGCASSTSTACCVASASRAQSGTQQRLTRSRAMAAAMNGDGRARRVPEIPLPALAGARSAAAVPLIVGDDLLGMLYLHDQSACDH